MTFINGNLIFYTTVNRGYDEIGVKTQKSPGRAEILWQQSVPPLQGSDCLCPIPRLRPGDILCCPCGARLDPFHQGPKRLLKTKEISSFNDYSIFGNIFGVRKLACALQYKRLLCSCLKAACKRPSFACGPHSKLKIYHSMRLASFGTISLARGCCLSPLRNSMRTYVSYFFALLWRLCLNLFPPFIRSVAFACSVDSVL